MVVEIIVLGYPEVVPGSFSFSKWGTIFPGKFQKTSGTLEIFTTSINHFESFWYILKIWTNFTALNQRLTCNLLATSWQQVDKLASWQYQVFAEESFLSLHHRYRHYW